VLKAGGTLDAHGKRVPWDVKQADSPGVWHFDMRGRNLPSGTYVFSVSTADGFFQPLHAKMSICVRPRPPAIVRCVWLTDEAPAVRMGGTLPALGLLITDERRHALDPPPSISIAQLACVALKDGRALPQ
jgi:hypothetical protein